MSRTVFAAVAVAILLAAPAMAAPVIIAPPSEHQDADLDALVMTLAKAAAAKDFAPFEAAMTPTATASFGGDEGPAGFRRAYGVDQPDSPFWSEWAKASALGGTFEESEIYVLPYTSSALPDDADPYSSLIAVGEKTALYDAPKADAKVIGDVTHQLLEQLDVEPADLEKTGPDFVHVKADMGEGYVRIAEVRSPIDYRAIFEKIDGKWKLTAFVAGD
jgi:hypothetical protein